MSRDFNKPTLILEFKRVKNLKVIKRLKSQLEQAAQEALAQISEQKYHNVLQQRGSQKLLKIGIAFCGKHFAIEWESQSE